MNLLQQAIMRQRWYDKSASETARNGAEALAFGTRTQEQSFGTSARERLFVPWPRLR